MERSFHFLRSGSRTFQHF